MRLCRIIVAFSLCAALSLSAVRASAAVIYADNFDRANNTNLGSTSTGGFAWVETKHDTNTSANADLSILSNTLRIQSASNFHDMVSGYVGGAGANLDAIELYTVAFKYFHTPNTSSPNSAFFILPRAEGDDFPTNVGWAFRNTNNNSNFTVHRYTGEARSGAPDTAAFLTVGSSLATLAVNTWHDVLIEVSGNSATLKIGSSTIDANLSLGSPFGNSTADRVLLGYNALAASGRAMDVRVDDLVVTQVPEPSTFALAALALLGLGALGSFRRRSGGGLFRK